MAENKVTLSPEKQEEVVKYFTSVINSLNKERSELVKTKIPEWHSRARGDYKANKDIENKQFDANVHIPITAWIVTSNEARINNAIFSGDDIAMLKYTRPDMDPMGQLRADKIQRFLRYDFEKRIKFEEKQRDGTQRLCVEGTEVKKVIFENRIVQQKTYEKNFKEEGGKKTFMGYVSEFAETVIDGLKKILPTGKIKIKPYEKKDSGNNIYNVALENFLWWGGEHVQDCEGTAEKLYMSYRKIMNMVKSSGWINIEKLRANYYIKTYGKEWEEKREALGITSTSDMTMQFTPYEIYAYYDINGDGHYENCMFVIDIDAGVLLYYDVNRNFWGMRPYVTTPLFHKAGFLAGDGYPQRLAGLNDELDTLHDHSLNNSTMVNSGTSEYIPNNLYHHVDNLTIKMGDCIPVKQFGAIKPIEFGKLALDLSYQQEFVKQLIQYMGIVTPDSLGYEVNVERPTARGKALNLQEFAVNFSIIMNNVKLGLRDMILMMLRNLYQYMPSDGIPFPVIDSKGNYIKDDQGNAKHETLMREDLEIIEELDIYVTANAVNAIKGIEMQNALMLYEKLMPQAVQTGEIKSTKLAEILVKAIDKKYLPELLNDPQAIQQMQSMFQQLNQRMEQVEATAAQQAEKEQDILIKEKILRGQFRNEEQENAARQNTGAPTAQ